MKKLLVTQPAPPAEEVPAEIIATAILDIAKGVKAMEASRLNRQAIVTLLHQSSGVARRDIIKVLDALDTLEKDWLKPAKPPRIRP